jgi:asparagine synthase (glutamine-hydrolysing)
MCGITGFIDRNGQSSKSVLDDMVSTLEHRGPDDRGSEVFDHSHGKVGFGQTRLSIIDLSPAGHQPMHFGDYTIVYNGEIYNYQEIKQELEKNGHKFKSTSDTEVILHAFKEWGVDCVKNFIGMFAFLIYDRIETKVYGFRDRAGVKPLYYYKKNGLFLFGSELKALHKHPGFEKRIDERALKSYFDFGYIPSPHSIYKNTYKLEPGHFLVYDLKNAELNTIEYWNSNAFYKQPKFEIDYEEAKQELLKLLKSAFQYRMIADVPVGIFLSGGYDSSAVAAILQNESSQKLKTFTIEFQEGNNEAPYARETAAYLGTDHHEYTCTSKEAQNIIPDLPYYYDEPFADSSAIPTTLVSRFARNHVTVALSADAGDELFAGYNSYPQFKNNQNNLNKIPPQLINISSTLFSLASKITPAETPSLKHKLKSISKSVDSDRFEQAAKLFKYSNSLPDFYMDRLFVNGHEKYPTKFDINVSDFKDAIEIPLAVDYQSYLQNDILTKVDRATMSVSLEGREPLVDHRILEFSARLPLDYKMNGLNTKRILKDIVHLYLPKEMMERPKTGFSLPIYTWLRDDLSWLIDENLNPESIKLSGIFNESFITGTVKRFQRDKFYYEPLVWKLLMFQLWFKRWM